MHKKMLGFGLVELVIGIVFVGLLMVIALPKFMDFSAAEKPATVNAS